MKDSNVIKEYAGTYKLYNNEDTKTMFFLKTWNLQIYLW